MAASTSVFNTIRSQSTDVLDKNVEWDLHRKWKFEHCKRSGEVLIRAHYRSVIKWTMHYSHAWDNKDDLASAGLEGLALALSKFDPEREVSFHHFSDYWIRHKVSELASFMRLPINGGARSRGSRWLRLRREAAKVEHITDPVEKEKALAVLLETTPENARRALMLLGTRIVWMDADPDGDRHSHHETIAAEASEACADALLSGRVQAALAKLKPRQREIIERRVLGEQTLQEVGDALGLTRERIRQLEAEAMTQLRRSLAALSLDEDVDGEVAVVE